MKTKEEINDEKTLKVNDRHCAPFLDAAVFIDEVHGSRIGDEPMMRFWLAAADHWVVVEEVTNALSRVSNGEYKNENAYKDLNVLKLIIKNV